MLGSAAANPATGEDQRARLRAVLAEIDDFAERYPQTHRDELRAMRQIVTGALMID